MKKELKNLLWALGWPIILVIGAFNVYGEPWAEYAANIFNVYIIFVCIGIFGITLLAVGSIINATNGKEDDVEFGKVVDELGKNRAETHQAIVIINDLSRLGILVVTFMVGWYWSASLILIFTFVYYMMISGAKDRIFAKLRGNQ